MLCWSFFKFLCLVDHIAKHYLPLIKPLIRWQKSSSWKHWSLYSAYMASQEHRLDSVWFLSFFGGVYCVRAIQTKDNTLSYRNWDIEWGWKTWHIEFQWTIFFEPIFKKITSGINELPTLYIRFTLGLFLIQHEKSVLNLHSISTITF